MSSAQKRPNTTRILQELKDFQQETVEYVYRRLYEDADAVKRFLIADEVGLGKTLVARGVIAKAVDRLWEKVDRIDIVYVCANRDIARQNINRLNITGEPNVAVATRMTLLPRYLRNPQGKLSFVSFTPKTSFDLRSQGGIAEERALIYHILRKGWDFGNVAGPKNLLQCNVGKHKWHKLLDKFDTSEEKIDSELEQAYLDALQEYPDIRHRFDDLVKRYAHYRKRQNIPSEDHQERLVLLGDLRRILAESCVNALEPDIVILDEFQRFKYLLDGEDEVALLAQALFNYPDVKVLLLSATPYKMYTLYHESNDDDHYRDFIRTARFLFDSEEETETLRDDLSRYRKALFHVGASSGSDLYQTKEAIETKLRKVMVRTERLSVTADRDAMIESREDLGKLTPQELHSFAMLDNVARTLGVRDTVEYWKSAPYLLNLMDRQSYEIKRKFVDSVEKQEYPDDLVTTLRTGKESLLSWDTIRSYARVDPGNAKLRTLIAQTVERGAWQLLWIPPSLPYYAVTNSPFTDPALKGFTKALVFSSWQVVPKAIAILCSYDAERRMVSAFDPTADYEERRKRRPLLRFAFSRTAFSEDRYTGMSNFTLLYPCLTLASLIDPLEICVNLTNGSTLPDVHQVTNTISDHIRRLIAPILDKHASSGGRADERWYWAALALLDHHHYARPVRQWFGSEAEGVAWREMVRRRGRDDADSHFAEHVDLFCEYFAGKAKLGRPPDDLVNVLTKVALASPAVVTLRSLLRFYPQAKPGQPADHTLAAAAKVALGFRSLFNLPDSITLLRSLQPTDDARYWENVLDYCINGNLQSVMDEYIHVLRGSLGLLIATSADVAIKYLMDEIHTAISITTVRLEFDEIRIRTVSKKIELPRHSVRCKFALRFGDDVNEEGEETRADQVRSAFNSPFRPFILATTSIGQEGLDFHQYCHAIYHWNLPSNPVDLEQREGRVHRYKGHVIRRNVARKFPLSLLNGRVSHLVDPWEILFTLASKPRAAGQNALIPFWIFEVEDGYKVYRHIPALPLSRERERLGDLRRTLVAYRMVFGQPRQEDLVNYLQSRSEGDLDLGELLRHRIDLSPKSQLCSHT